MGRVACRSSQRIHWLAGISEEPPAYGAELSPAREGEGRGAVKKGAALLSGLLRCGRCGRKMQVLYSGCRGEVARYGCSGGRELSGIEFVFIGGKFTH